MLNVIIFLLGACIMFYMALRSVMARRRLCTQGEKVQATVEGTVQSRDSYTFCGAVHNLAEYLIGRYGKGNLCFILPLWRYDEDNPYGEDGTQAKARPSLKEYVRAEAAVLDALGVRYLNLRDVFPVPPTKAPSEYYVDGLHPTDKGHELLAKCIVRYLTDNGKA